MTISENIEWEDWKEEHGFGTEVKVKVKINACTCNGH